MSDVLASFAALTFGVLSFGALAFPNIDPVMFTIGPIQVRWYGLAYAAGMLLGWQFVRWILSTPRFWPKGKAPFAVDQADKLLLMIAAGVVVGGRVGYVLFYKPGYFLANPAEIFMPWNGGMSFHGGFIGAALAIVLFARSEGANPLTVFDLAAASTPIGLFFGRLANFINAELWGRPSTVPWSMVFPGAGPEPRHPSQIYEAVTEGLILFLVCYWLIQNRAALKRPGLVAGTFTAGYGIARSFCELFREPDFEHWATFGPFTAGILYSLPMIVAGILLIRRAQGRSKSVA